MQRMRPHIPPEPIQPNLAARCPRPRHLKHPTRNPRRCIRRHNLHARNPLRYVSALLGCDVPFRAVVDVDGGDFEAGDVGEGGGGAEVREEGAVALQNVGF